MDAFHKYCMALGAFRAQTLLWIASARQVAEAARQLESLLRDPADEPLAAEVCAELVPELRALFTQVVGLRHLLLHALGDG